MSAAPSVAIIGAGLAGLTAARELQPHAKVSVFEKSRGLGGRIATRYADPYQFDHGAQHFTAKSDAFKQWLVPLLEAGIVAQWNARFAEMHRCEIQTMRRWGEPFPHYVAVPRMNVLGTYLGEGLSVLRECTIASIRGEAGAWELLDDKQQSLGTFDWVIVSAPAAQACALMPDSFAHHAALQSPQMLGCYALMLGFEQPLPLPWDAALIKGADISWVSVNSSKPQRDTGFSLVAHSTNAWAQSHIDDALEPAQAHLMRELSEVIGHDVSKAAHVAVHRWRYANIEKQLHGFECFTDSAQQLIACGDWCIRGRIEAAFLSGLAAANACTKVINA